MTDTYKTVEANITPRTLLAPYQTTYEPEDAVDATDTFLNELYAVVSDQRRDLDTTWYGFNVAQTSDWGDYTDTETVDGDEAQALYDAESADTVILESTLADYETADGLVRGTVRYVPKARADEYFDGGHPRDKQQLDTVTVEMDLNAHMLPSSHTMDLLSLVGKRDHTLGFSGLGIDDLIDETKALAGYLRNGDR